MLAVLSTLMILTAASFAVIAMGMTLAGSWKLIMAALNLSSVSFVHVPQPRRSTGPRQITVSRRSPSRLSNVAA